MYQEEEHTMDLAQKFAHGGYQMYNKATLTTNFCTPVESKEE